MRVTGSSLISAHPEHWISTKNSCRGQRVPSKISKNESSAFISSIDFPSSTATPLRATAPGTKRFYRYKMVPLDEELQRPTVTGYIRSPPGTGYSIEINRNEELRLAHCSQLHKRCFPFQSPVKLPVLAQNPMYEHSSRKTPSYIRKSVGCGMTTTA